MGIKNLSKLIIKYAPRAIQYKTIEQYKNSSMVVDANLMIYKNIYAIRMNGYDIKNGDIIVTHIHAMLLKLIGFMKHSIIAAFVFDGGVSDMKKWELDKRKKAENDLKLKYENAIGLDEKKKYYFAKSGVVGQDIEDCMELIKLFGYTVVVAPEESDSQMVHMNCDYIVTDDMDILLFGGKKMLKNFSVASKKKIQEIDLEILKKDSGLSQNMLIEVGVLLGCDYCDGFSMGIVKTYKLIKEFEKIENIPREKIEKIPKNYEIAVEYFKDAPFVPVEEIKTVNINRAGLVEFLYRFGYKDEYINKLLDKL